MEKWQQQHGSTSKQSSYLLAPEMPKFCAKQSRRLPASTDQSADQKSDRSKGKGKGKRTAAQRPLPNSDALEPKAASKARPTTGKKAAKKDTEQLEIPSKCKRSRRSTSMVNYAESDQEDSDGGDSGESEEVIPKTRKTKAATAGAGKCDGQDCVIELRY